MFCFRHNNRIEMDSGAGLELIPVPLKCFHMRDETVEISRPETAPERVDQRITLAKVENLPKEEIVDKMRVKTRSVKEKTGTEIGERRANVEKAAAVSVEVSATAGRPAETDPASSVVHKVDEAAKIKMADAGAEQKKQTSKIKEDPVGETAKVSTKMVKGRREATGPTKVTVSASAEVGSAESRLSATAPSVLSGASRASVPGRAPTAELVPDGPEDVSVNVESKKTAAASGGSSEEVFTVKPSGTVKKMEGGSSEESAAAVRVSGAEAHGSEARMGAGSVDAKPKVAAMTGAKTELRPGARTDSLAPRLSFSIRSGKGGRTQSVSVSLAKYSGGDWDCSSTAMMYLAHQIQERTGMALETSDKIVDIASPELMKVPFVYMTGHKNFIFTEQEVRNLARYLERGGHLWADDSTHFNDEAFDAAFRREIARVLPGKKLERLSRNFTGFRTGYDLSRGYRGYAIPPGDKYRLDYMEGIRIGDRVAVVYTRNDYGDGLNIDPNTHPLKPSLTDLSPAEMQEGAVQMGINLILYFLTSGTDVEASFLAGTTSKLREAEDKSRATVPKGEVFLLDELDMADGWQVDGWGDTVSVAAAGKKLQAQFSVGPKKKVAFTKNFAKSVRIAASDAIVIDAENRLRCGVRLAIGISSGGKYHETQPFYLKPGKNTAFFRMSAKTFKSEQTKWEYTASLPTPAVLDTLTILIYSPAPGRILLDNLRVVK